MKRSIAILGEYTPTSQAHLAIIAAIEHSCALLETDIEGVWVPTEFSGSCLWDRFRGVIRRVGLRLCTWKPRQSTPAIRCTRRVFSCWSASPRSSRTAVPPGHAGAIAGRRLALTTMSAGDRATQPPCPSCVASPSRALWATKGLRPQCTPYPPLGRPPLEPPGSLTGWWGVHHGGLEPSLSTHGVTSARCMRCPTLLAAGFPWR
jgi:hypothetical protein